MNANELEPSAQRNRATTDKLRADFRVLAADTEQLLKVTANQTAEHVAQVRATVEESLQALKARIAELQEVALTRTRVAGRATDAYLHANPWQVMAIGAVAGLVFGILLARGTDSDDSR
jgi:ElaB/YqjD/DUF883 family membrane-anchored ribosome-binding protein